jgi:NAD+ synthase (glutamine-hydrolysing)
MKLIKVAAAALNQTPLDWDRNLANVRAALEDARARDVSVLCLPELCITGYGCEDAFLSPAVREMAVRVLQEILPETRGLIVSVGLPVLVSGAVYNTCALIDDTRLLGFVGKRALAGDGIHYEPRWFKPWPRGAHTWLRVAGKDVPIGDLSFDCGGVRVGFEICEDAWTVERPGAALALDAVDIILNPSASHFAFGKHEVRRRLVLEGSRAFGATYVYANLLGNEAGRAIYDGDVLIASAGEVLAEGRRFSFADRQLITATVDVELTRTRRSWVSSFRPRVARPEDESVTSQHVYPDVPPEAGTHALAPWEAGAHVKEEEFARAIALGLFDYLRKSKSQGFVVSMSGGADSSAVASLVALALDFAAAELGFEGLRERLGHVKGLADTQNVRDAVSVLLTGAYQGTRNSSDTTRNAARMLAEALGASYHELDVDGLVAAYEAIVEKAIGRPLDWERDDVARQNIQARVRSPSVWMLANLAGKLLLSTSNRSEAAVGYATMDGDTSGGLSPIAGIDKAYLRRWLEWLEKSGPEGVGPIPALRAVNVQAPTAELRPSEKKQTDEDDLMPYVLLDAVERAAIRDKRSPLEVFRLVRVEFPQYEQRRLAQWVERFFVLFSRNQWKRERYAPSFHVDDENLDPKTWCRWPILSGGFQRELEELRALVEREEAAAREAALQGYPTRGAGP